jgi:pimeloyl-[acyl-carrier protein] methyl ester esterase
MHGGVWGDVAKSLSQQYQVHYVDLPGFGASAALAKTDLDSLVQSLSEHFIGPVNVCGWSLGGQIAMHWAVREPDKVKKLVVVTSTPCFTERDDWLFGLPSEVLEKFAAELEQNHAATLRRFISLQLRGSENERELLTKLREQLFSRGEPDMSALRGGLEILRDADQRSEVAGIKQQTLVIAGQRDKLTPPAASYYLAQVIPNSRLVEIEGAAHTPFLSHPNMFVAHVSDFLKNN